MIIPEGFPTAEPYATAILFITLGALLTLSVVMSRTLERLPIPVTLVFLFVGMLAGSEGLGRVAFTNYEITFRIGVAALVFILVDGGLNTPAAMVRAYLAPAGVLASVGVIGTTALFAVAAHLLGFSWPTALLLGAVVSSTDVASLLAVLRGSRLSLRERVGMTLELESGLNDPTAVILTTILTTNLAPPHSAQVGPMLVEIVREIGIGLAGGALFGYAGRWILLRLRLNVGSLYPVFTLGLSLFAFALPTLVGGSGFLAVYVGALVLGNGPLPHRSSLTRIHDAVAWLGQVAMFLVLGLLVFPSRLLEVWRLGLVLALILAFVARPIVVTICLLPFRYSLRETAFVSWVGVRGAVPIILATIPVLARVRGAERLFDLVFFMVVVNAILPGATIPWLSRRLGLTKKEPPPAPATVEVDSRHPIQNALLSFYIDQALGLAGERIADLPLPEGSAITLVARADEILAPNVANVLEVGDHVYVLTRPDDEALVRLMFGTPEV